MDSNKVLFVSGIDTGVGKTYATGILLREMREKGLRVISQKPVQTGCEGRSEDLDVHDALAPHLDPEQRAEPYRCTYLYKYPASPHLSAQLEQRPIDPKKIDSDTQELLSQGYDRILMEGAGGLMVPLTPELLTLDFIAQGGYPVALVTSGRLGSINHTLLSLQALQDREIPVERVIYNHYPPEESPIAQETIAYLRHYLASCCPSTLWQEIGYETLDSSSSDK